MKRTRGTGLNRQRLTALARLFALALLVGSALLSPHFAAPAAASGYGYTWTIEFDFDAGFDGTLTVEAGPGTVGALDKVYVSEEFTVSCAPNGVVNQGGGVATFDGGYLVCDLELGRAIVSTFERCKNVDPSCDYTLAGTEAYDNLQMTAEVLSIQPGAAPLLHMPDVFFGANVTAANVILYTKLNPAGGMNSLFVTSPLGSFQSYGSLYTCQFGPPCNSEFSVSGVTQAGGPWPFVDQAEIQMGRVQLLIGHDPGTGLTIPNGTQINYLTIDPPNMGNG
jgi:hypothetical protein